ncbi:MAG: signal recognition particle-docking protein FtsY [Bacilli bacterium]
MGLLKLLKKKFSKEKNEDSSQIEEKTYEAGLAKSRKGFADKLGNLSKKYHKINESYFEELEETLIEADVGVGLSLKIIEELISDAKANKISDSILINELLVDKLFEGYMKGEEELVSDITFNAPFPSVILMVGVNGVGKTTSIAKLANRYKNMGKKVMLVAADTFRAAAKEQLEIWAKRLDVKLISGSDKQDPASLVYDGCQYAKANNYDLLIVDTAGRLQNKDNLMAELSKMKKIINREMSESPIETFLVLDATTGQNGVVQAKSFFTTTAITGIIVTKMDGTSKGGIILSIRDELNIPVRFIGFGETLNDLLPFDLNKYIYALCVSPDSEEE